MVLPAQPTGWLRGARGEMDTLCAGFAACSWKGKDGLCWTSWFKAIPCMLGTRFLAPAQLTAMPYAGSTVMALPVQGAVTSQKRRSGKAERPGCV